MKTCPNCTKYQAKSQPRNNCSSCWDEYLSMNPGRVLAIDTGLGLVGKEGVAKVTGDKFLKHYFRFKEKQNAS